MERKQFLKFGALSASVFAAGKALGGRSTSETDTAQTDASVGFNHLPNNKNDTDMENTVLHKADTRGVADHGWLNSHHSFSFASYYNPDRMNFGVLRVLNDDVVAPGMGFGTHPHDNMEIISIPLEGDLQHKDSIGNVAIIKEGDIQVMSAGTGVQHSEQNASKEKPVKFLQIWVMPKERNVKPRYDQIALDMSKRNELTQILSPSPEDAGVWINQNAWFSIGNLDAGFAADYKLNDKRNGVYVFVLDGNVTVSGQKLNNRDGFGLWNRESIDIKADGNARVLLMEVPMKP
jgi:redox-sensitive bicupin YhaK (pirin superfamily)